MYDPKISQERKCLSIKDTISVPAHFNFNIQIWICENNLVNHVNPGQLTLRWPQSGFWYTIRFTWEDHCSNSVPQGPILFVQRPFGSNRIVPMLTKPLEDWENRTSSNELRFYAIVNFIYSRREISRFDDTAFFLIPRATEPLNSNRTGEQIEWQTNPTVILRVSIDNGHKTQRSCRSKYLTEHVKFTTHKGRIGL